MLKIGITGGIGTGKSFVAELLKEAGIPVFDADSEAKKLYEEPAILAEVETLFGPEIILDGKLVPAKLAGLVFSQPQKLQSLNELIHPLVRQRFIEWTKKQNCKMVAMESALLYESGFENLFDKVIVIDAPEEIRKERIRKRNPNWSDDEIEKRMASQMSQDEKCRRADFVITNDGKTNLKAQLIKIKEF